MLGRVREDGRAGVRRRPRVAEVPSGERSTDGVWVEDRGQNPLPQAAAGRPAGAAAEPVGRALGAPGHEVIDVGRPGDGDGDLVVADHDLATGDGVVVGQDPDLVRRLRVERDHSAAAHAQQLLHRQRRAAKHDGNLDVDGADLVQDFGPHEPAGHCLGRFARHIAVVMLDRSLSEAPAEAPFGRSDARPVGWAVSEAAIGYAEAVAAMESRAAAIAEGTAGELVWLLEHPPLYTAGVSAKPGDLLDPDRFPVFEAGRGGQYTYHGPGQRVAYVMLDLTRRSRDVRAFVAALEAWVIAALKRVGVAGWVVPGRVGVWTETSSGEAKIAAIGVRLRRWVSFHGIAL